MGVLRPMGDKPIKDWYVMRFDPPAHIFNCRRPSGGKEESGDKSDRLGSVAAGTVGVVPAGGSCSLRSGRR